MFEKHVNDRLIDHIEKYGLFLIFSMDSSLLDQLQIIRQLYMIELDISRDFDKVWYAALLSKLYLMDFQVSYQGLFYKLKIYRSRNIKEHFSSIKTIKGLLCSEQPKYL